MWSSCDGCYRGSANLEAQVLHCPSVLRGLGAHTSGYVADVVPDLRRERHLRERLSTAGEKNRRIRNTGMSELARRSVNI
jgi:hypothetical protein